MIALNKEQLFKLLKDGITVTDKQTPANIELKIDPNLFRYNRSNNEWYYDAKDVTKFVIKYKMLGTYYTQQYKYLNIANIKYFIKKEFPDLTEMKIDIRAKDSDFRQYTGKDDENLMDAVDISVQIYHDDKVELKDKELIDLIDFALMIKDEVWFNELTEQYNR